MPADIDTREPRATISGIRCQSRRLWSVHSERVRGV